MQVPIEIRFTNTERSEAVEAAIRERAAKLERFADDIVSCRVSVDAPHRHHRQGKIFHVAVDLRVPGGEVIASRNASDNHAHEDVYVAVRDAFNAAKRQLQECARLRRDRTQDASPLGTVTTIHLDENSGWITASDGRELFFDRHSLVNTAFEKLETGAEVRYSETSGEHGPKATGVHVVAKLPPLID